MIRGLRARRVWEAIGKDPEWKPSGAAVTN